MSLSSDIPAPQVPGLDLTDAMAQLGLSWEELRELLETFPDAVRREARHGRLQRKNGGGGKGRLLAGDRGRPGEREADS